MSGRALFFGGVFLDSFFELGGEFVEAFAAERLHVELDELVADRHLAETAAAAEVLHAVTLL